MNETTFKVLMHDGRYVDENLLPQGIFYVKSPQKLYSKDDTIKLIEDCRRFVRDFNGNIWSDSHVRNLRQCELITVTLLIK